MDFELDGLNNFSEDRISPIPPTADPITLHPDIRASTKVKPNFVFSQKGSETARRSQNSTSQTTYTPLGGELAPTTQTSDGTSGRSPD